MALDSTTLASALLTAYQKAQKDQASGKDSTKTLTDDIASAIETFIKTATVTTPSGVAVSTAGSAAAQTGATTAPGIGTIS